MRGVKNNKQQCFQIVYIANLKRLENASRNTTNNLLSKLTNKNFCDIIYIERVVKEKRKWKKDSKPS